MRRLYTILMILTTLAIFVSCEVVGDGVESVEVSNDVAINTSSTISPSCVVESRSVSRAKSAGIAVRSLIDQITTKQMDSNFLRIDEDLDAINDGLYTFTGNDPTTPYHTNWNKALLLESTVISSPDNTEGIHYRSVSLAPEQSYKMNIVEEKIDGVIHRDTTHFYHTRMVGWYPMNCRLPRKEGVPATAQFDFSEFDEDIEIVQQVAVADVVRGVEMFRHKQVNVPILGIIENMAWFTPEELPNNRYYLFGKEGAKRYAEENNIELLGQVPIIQSIMEGSESGRPAGGVDMRVEEYYQNIAEKIVNNLNVEC